MNWNRGFFLRFPLGPPGGSVRAAVAAGGAKGREAAVTVDLESATRVRTARPRADAARNRERIVTAAREALVEFGPEVPMDEVARRAGVGNATLYRHFTDRADLIRQVTLALMASATRRAEDA